MYNPITLKYTFWKLHFSSCLLIITDPVKVDNSKLYGYYSYVINNSLNSFCPVFTASSTQGKV